MKSRMLGSVVNGSRYTMPKVEEPMTKECFGRRIFCIHPSECPVNIECVEKKIERIRKTICGYNF